MSDFLCGLWPWILGALLGWLAAGWLARTALRRKPRVVERTVDRLIDNPTHIKRIAELEARPPQVVEKIVDRPVDRIVEKIVEKPVDRIVEKVVEKLVDNPVHLRRVAALEGEVAVIAGLRARISELEARPPKIVEKIVDRPVDRPVDRIVEKIVTDTSGVEDRDRQLADWRGRYAALQAQLAAAEATPVHRELPPPTIKEPVAAESGAFDLTAAVAAGFRLRRPDDLTVVEGIGPKISGLLNDAGCHRWTQLAQMQVTAIKKVLDEAGPRYALADPRTWPQQAALAASNQWVALRTLQNSLDGGRVAHRSSGSNDE